MKGKPAIVYPLSRTLDLVVIGDGTLWFQRNDRTPFRLSSSETKALAEFQQANVAVPTIPDPTRTSS